MIIISFSKKTSKIFPKIFCKKYKHCAPIIKKGNQYILIQFIKYKNIKYIKLNKRDLTLLHNAGWDFIKINCNPNYDFKNTRTCVSLVKKIIGLRIFFIQTPYALYKKLKRP